MHEKKRCACCEETFECKAGTIAQCQCNNVVLSPEARKNIEERFLDCICADCLLVLKNEYKGAKGKFIFE